ncbi:MAG: class I SAM-dependent methyltransferase [Deltaproteobacteria bacterium]|nr:class I SAM-dependent methyltransferase [Deltaproteobacteria bacterium]
MSLGILAKAEINRFLKFFNLRLETLTAEKLEAARLAALVQRGHFAGPVFPRLRLFESNGNAQLFEAIGRYRSRFDDFEDPSRNDVGYSFDNGYFSSPDAEVLYTVVREFRPRLVVEVGSGHSTRIMRQAVLDGGLHTRLISVEPEPRVDVEGFVNKIYRMPVEKLYGDDLFRFLKEGDILFIDSSHAIEIGNDVVFLYLILLPELPPGVLIHIHDVFLPYDYPKEWMLPAYQGWKKPYRVRTRLREAAETVMIARRKWNEQYLVQALLMFTNSFDVLWAGHFLQRTRPDFLHHFPHWKGGTAGSLWLRKTT